MKKVLKLDSAYRIIEGDGIEIVDTLPAGVYELKHAEDRGFWFEKMELAAFPGKVYGTHGRMMSKVVRRYESTSGRNLGVLLSGEKGTGKSLFVRNLAVKLSETLPVIVVKTNRGREMLDVLAGVGGRAVLVFDEFEKMFRGDAGPGMADTRESDVREQETVLSFLDGVETRQEKLILLTVNNTWMLSKYLLGRPGRIHYHFVMTIPGHDDIEEYLFDNLHVPGRDGLADRLAARALNWDALAAVVAELNAGESYEDTVRDLNLSSDAGNAVNLDAVAVFEDGQEDDDHVDVDRNSSTVEIVFDANTVVGGQKRKAWRRVEFDVSDLVPAGMGEYLVSKFRQTDAMTYNDEPAPASPRVKEIRVSKTSVISSLKALDGGGAVALL